jgi:tetratricopeptide (TPR) repeat protein
MIALALAAAVALSPAQQAFDRGDYARAEALALAEAPTGASLYLAALARFRAGDPQAALELLRRAGRAQDPPSPALWHFNQAACLYELGRFREAESEYLKAAEDGSLTVVALVDAAFAALDGGSPPRAKELAARARAGASDERALELLADLDAHLAGAEREKSVAEYKDGLDAYDAGNYVTARERFLRAAALDPSDGRSRIMAAASAFRLGARDAAREELDRALMLHLDEADVQTARAYLNLLGDARRWEGTARLAAGFDSNPQQTGLLQPNEFPGQTTTGGSALTTAEVSLSWRTPPRDDEVKLEFDYGLSQIAYVEQAAADRSLQQHLASLSLQSPLTKELRGGLLLGGEMDFTGLGGFRGLQGAARFGGWLSLEETLLTSTRVDLAVSRKEGMGSEFNYLTGNRVDAAVTQDMLIGAFTLDVGYAFRLEDIGSAPTCLQSGPGACTNPPVEAFGYTSHTLWFAMRTQPVQPLTLEFVSGLDLRAYADAAQTFAGSTRTFSPQRDDQFFFGSATASFRVSSKLALSLRYDLVNNASNSPSSSASGTRSYMKSVLSLGTLFWW